MLVTGFLASTVLCYSQNPDPRSGNIYATDAGSWVGLRAGFQSNGGALDERWSIAGSYELRSPSAASILIDYHLWHERYRNTANPTDTERLEMFGIVDLDFKIRYNVSRISFSMRGGVGTGTGLAPVSFNYGLGVEYLLNGNLSITLMHKRYAFPEFDHFFSAGIIVRLP